MGIGQRYWGSLCCSKAGCVRAGAVSRAHLGLTPGALRAGCRGLCVWGSSGPHLGLLFLGTCVHAATRGPAVWRGGVWSWVTMPRTRHPKCRKLGPQPVAARRNRVVLAHTPAAARSSLRHGCVCPEWRPRFCGVTGREPRISLTAPRGRGFHMDFLVPCPSHVWPQGLVLMKVMLPQHF